MTEFRVAGVKAGYHTGESLTAWGWGWGFDCRAEGLGGRGPDPLNRPDPIVQTGGEAEGQRAVFLTTG